ncbi:MAG TPA: type VII secretion target [Amycolatopsis sp.]|nr:type VII secretion target [Amycolatopsis sp.]
MADWHVDTDVMREYAQTVDGLHDRVSKINDYMKTTACDKSGFTGLFTLLQPVVDLVGNLYGETLEFGHNRLTSLADGMRSAADAYDHHDGQAAAILKEFQGDLQSIASATPAL